MADEINAANFNQPRSLKRIDELKKKLVGTDRDDHLDQVAEWEKTAKRALLKLDLKKHQGIRILVDEIQTMVNETNELLLNAKSKELTDSQRDGLIEKKEFMEWFLGFFGEARKELATVEKELDEQLDEEGVDNSNA